MNRNEEPMRKCPKCGEELVRTSEQYLACPNGHGKLQQASNIDRQRAQAQARDFERRCDQALQAIQEARR